MDAYIIHTWNMEHDALNNTDNLDWKVPFWNNSGTQDAWICHSNTVEVNSYNNFLCEKEEREREREKKRVKRLGCTITNCFQILSQSKLFLKLSADSNTVPAESNGALWSAEYRFVYGIGELHKPLKFCLICTIIRLPSLTPCCSLL